MHTLKDSSLLRTQAYIDACWLDADNQARFSVTNPATGAVLAQVPRMGAAETTRAIAAADRAWPAWKALTPRARAAIMLRWQQEILAHADDLARIMTLEQGKPLADARSEVVYAASFVEYFAEEGKR
ncbi:MAG: aldehyde dehydrogenase family protein, partial [Rhodocyclales bacterium]|nr:aldehyde dehydrogenase family protein [Rhodocyclales bacterium]